MRFRRACPVASAGFYPAAFGRSGLSCMGLDDHCPLSSNPISAGIGMTRWPCFYVLAIAVRHKSSARRPERAIGRSLGFLPLTHRETGRLACVSFRIRRIFRFLVAAYGFVYRAGYAFGLHCPIRGPCGSRPGGSFRRIGKERHLADSRSRLRWRIASAMWAGAIRASPARSAIVRATLTMRS